MEINGLHWKVVLDENDSLSENDFGNTIYSTQTIVINKNICEETRERTLIHEIVHAYAYSYGYYEKDSYNREELCDFVAHNLININVLYKLALLELKGK